MFTVIIVFPLKNPKLKNAFINISLFFCQNGAMVTFLYLVYKLEKMNLRDLKGLAQAYVTQVRLEPRCIEENFIEILRCVMHRMNIIKTNMVLS